MTFFLQKEKPIRKFLSNFKGQRIAKTLMKEKKKKKKAGGPTLSDFKTYYKSTITKTVWHKIVL